MPASDPILAGSILVTTKVGQVLIGKRKLGFGPFDGYTTFPSGPLEAEDRPLAHRLFGRDDDEASARACALRHLYEAGWMVAGDHLVPRPDASFDEAIHQGCFQLADNRLQPAHRFVTPQAFVDRWDLRTFHLPIADSPPANDAPFAFSTLDDIWARFHALELLLDPPTADLLEALRRGRERIERHQREDAWESESAALTQALHLPFEPISGIRPLPLKTPTFPPAEHTNAYIIGHERLIIVDPATYDTAERERLSFFVQRLVDRGKTVDSVVLTHHHADHVGSAEWLAKHLNVPVRAHLHTRDLLRGKVAVDDLLDEGDVIDLGADAIDRPFHLGVFHTPGHAPGHLVLQDLRPGAHALIVGDMVAAIGTIIVDPPEGDMTQYIEQLERLEALDERSVLFAAHGPPILDGPGKFRHYVQHRLAREAKVINALRVKGSGAPHDLLSLAYDDTPPRLYPLAARACLAHLLKLVNDGRVVQQGTIFRILS